jgi:rhodanese-related sulfurtransferase
LDLKICGYRTETWLMEDQTMKIGINFPRLLLLPGLIIAMLAQGCENLLHSATVIDVGTAVDFIAKHEDAVILDVRRPNEFEESHILGSLNVPVQEASFKVMVANLDTDKKYIVHCTKNIIFGRTDRALRTMEKLGFKNLYSLKGGYNAWRDAKLPLSN